MAQHSFRTLVRPRPRGVLDKDPAFAHAAPSPWHGILALYGDYEMREPLAGLWLVPASGEQTMRSILAQIARELNKRGWNVGVDGLCEWWLGKTSLAVVAADFPPITGDDSGEGEYV